jgi:hypothetical protein
VIVDEQEVGHLPEQRAIGEITERAAEHGGEGEEQDPLLGRHLADEVDEEADRHHGRGEEERQTDDFVRVGEQAEGAAAVGGVDDREEARQHGDAVVQRQLIAHHPLGDLVEHDDGRAHQADEDALVHADTWSATGSARTTGWQRSQSSGCSASVPTCSL